MAAGVQSPEGPLSPRQWNKELGVRNGKDFATNFAIVLPSNLHGPSEAPRRDAGLLTLGQNHYSQPIYSALEAIGIDSRSHRIMVLSLSELGANPREIPDSFEMSDAGVFIRTNTLKGIEALVNTNPNLKLMLLKAPLGQVLTNLGENSQTKTLDNIVNDRYLPPIRRSLKHGYIRFGKTGELSFEILGEKVVDNFARLLRIQGRLLLAGDAPMAGGVQQLTQQMAFGKHIVGSVANKQLFALAA